MNGDIQKNYICKCLQAQSVKLSFSKLSLSGGRARLDSSACKAAVRSSSPSQGLNALERCCTRRLEN